MSRVLRAARLSRMRDLDPPAPPVRYEYREPGGLIHLDTKKLGRFDRIGHRITGKRTGNASSRASGWEFVHVCIDDASRVAFSQVLIDGRKERAVAFLTVAVAYYANRPHTHRLAQPRRPKVDETEEPLTRGLVFLAAVDLRQCHRSGRGTTYFA